MNLEEFRKEFIETVRAVAAAEENFQQSAFVDVAVKNLADAGEIADFEPCHYRGTGSRRRALWVDGFAFDDADDSVRLLVADWRGKDDLETLTQTDATALLGRVRAFVEEALTGAFHDQLEMTSEAYGLAKQLYAWKKSITRYRVYVVTDCVLSARIRDWPEEQIGGVPVDVHIWDIARLHRVVESKTGRDEIEVDFTGYERGGLPCLSASVETDQYKAYLCVISGEALARLYDEFGSRLLEGNVRSFLTVKGKVNKGIRATIIGEPEMFFAYNNGIAATASEADVRNGSGGLKLMRARDLQIVNGGQTTASLAMALQRDKAKLDGIFVQMKLSVIPPERSGEVIPLIAKYANSQNKVSDADFFSNHEFHRRMEQFSRRLWAPAVTGAQHETHWFYERARGQFANEQIKMSKSERAKFLLQNPRSQVITKTDLAKFENAYRALPHIVSLGAQKNFVAFAGWVGGQWERANDTFNEEFFRRAIAKAILFRRTEALVSAQPWYQGGYRANIVAYSVAKLVAMIEATGSSRELDFHAIWTKQVLSPAFERQLATIAASAADVIVHPPEAFQNVTEWCKKEQCWHRVLDLSLHLSKDFAAELVDTAMSRRVQKAARDQQEEDNRIDAQIKVVELGKNYWLGLAAWSRARKLVSEEDDKLLSLAVRMPVIVPTDRQSARLLVVKARMEEEGYRAR